MKEKSEYLNKFHESIFAKMSALARSTGAVNLGQGFPDFEGPSFVSKYLIEGVQTGHNQYAPFPGYLPLRSALSEIYKKRYQLDYCPETEITITTGATEGIFSTITALVNPGDEVVIFEPFYDSYVASVEMRGGVPKFVSLVGSEFDFDEGELKNAFSSKTKLVILNTPHNPTGKVFRNAELGLIRDLVIKYDSYVISDEVYEYLTFDDQEHTPVSKIDGLKERTIVISSAGKTFGYTGWKVGWCLAPRDISAAIRLTRQYITFSVNTPAQYAFSKCLTEIDNYLPEFQKLYDDKRKMVMKALDNLGWKYFRPKGTYFIMASLEGVSDLGDVDFCMDLIKKAGVVFIPPSVFYRKSNEGKRWVRICFAKSDQTLKDAIAKLSLY